MSETEHLFRKDNSKNTNYYCSINHNYNNKHFSSNIIMTTAKEVRHDEYHIHWRLHFYWTLAVICFIIAKLWWLVPLPGSEVLPAYRTYPANFLDTIFLTFGCALATRSIVVGLVKSFQEGIYPDSIVAFGSTGGFGAMWSCIRHRAGLRYFLIAMLVTACTLLGNALQGELQSSVRIYYKEGGSTSAHMAQCQHSTPTDFNLASSAYSSGLITNTLSDAASLLNSLNKNNSTQPIKSSFSVSLIKSTLTPIQNITFLPPQQLNKRILRRHHTSRPPASITTSVETPIATEEANNNNNNNPCGHHEKISTTTSSTEEEEVANNDENSNNNSDSDASISTNNNSAYDNDNSESASSSSRNDNSESGVTSVDCNTGTVNNSNVITNGNNNNSNDNNNDLTMNNNNSIDTNSALVNNDTSTLIISSASVAAAEVLAGFNSSKLMIIKSNINNKITALPYQFGQQILNISSSNIPIKLNVFRYTTPGNRNAVIVYSSSLADGIKAGVYVNAKATNYTCQSQGGNVMCDEGINYNADSKVVADAMVAAIQSGEGLYGTTTAVNSGNGITLDIVNGVDSTGKNSKLVDALFANPLCSSPDLLPTEGIALYPYSAGRFTPLVILWLVLFVILWLIGVYLIGYSEHTWTELASTGSLVPQIISKSPNMFEDNELGAKTVNQEMFLDPEEGKMNFAKVHRHGYTVTTAEVDT